MKPKNKIKILRLLATATALLALLVGTLAYTLSPAGLSRVAQMLERRLSTLLEADVSVEGMVLRWPLELELARFAVSEDDRIYLEVSEVLVQLSPRQLLRRHLWIHRVRSKNIEYDGWPQADVREPTRSIDLSVPDLSPLLNRVTITELKIERLALGDSALPQTADFRIESSLLPRQGSTAFRLSLVMTAFGGEGLEAGAPAVEVEALLDEPGSGQVRAEIAAKVADWRLLVTDWPAEMEDALALRGQLILEGGRYLRLLDMRVDSQVAVIDARAKLDTVRPYLNAQTRLEVADFAPLADMLNIDIEGGALFSALIYGPPANPELKVVLESARLRIAEHQADSIRIDLDIDDIAAAPRGAIRAAATVDDVPLAVSADYAWEAQTLTVRGLQAQALNIQAEGDARYDFATRLAQGELSVHSDEIAGISEHFGIDAAGRFQAELEVSPDSGRQNLTLAASAAAVRSPFGTVDSIRIATNLQDLFGEAHGKLELWTEQVQAEDLKIDRVEFNAVGGLQSIELFLASSGEFTESWSVDSRAAIEIAELRPTALSLHDFELRYGGIHLHLAEPAKLAREQDRYTVDRLIVDAGMGRLSASGFAGVDAIMLEADVRDVPLSIFGFAGVPPEAHGAMEGRLQVQGDPSAPFASLQLRFSDLMPTPDLFWDGPPASFSVDSKLDEGRLATRLLLEGLTGQPVELEIDIPLSLSLYPMNLEWPPEGAVSGQFKAETDLGELADLFVLDMHRLAGLLAVNMDLGGTVDSPEVTGYLRVTGGAYENALTGTILREIDVAVSGGDDRLVIERATATDGDRGRLSLSGELKVLPELEYPFAASLTLENFRLLRHDIARATGNGTAVWEGNLRASDLSGDMTVSPVELRIPERLPAELIDMDYIEINGGQLATDQPSNDDDQVLERHEISLNLDVAFPARVFVRGRGLESEWGGRVQVRGNAGEPQLSGNLSVLRGHFMFFGKRLTITHGLLSFTGAFPPAPLLDIVAESRSGGITAIMRLSGDLESPEIQLDSVPTLPEDEILARLLFGRSATRITPWQAITIAQAVNQLRGGGSTFDVMGETRRFLGVDRIEVRSDNEDDQHTSVSVGKYVGERVYVELERGVGVEGARAVVEVELTPTIRLETEMGTDVDAGLDVIWSWDY